MKDGDLIEGIKKADGEKLKDSLITELNLQRTLMGSFADATWWNALRSCLASVLKRAGIEVPN